jgi:hypothetical protein
VPISSVVVVDDDDADDDDVHLRVDDAATAREHTANAPRSPHATAHRHASTRRIATHSDDDRRPTTDDPHAASIEFAIDRRHASIACAGPDGCTHASEPPQGASSIDPHAASIEFAIDRHHASIACTRIRDRGYRDEGVFFAARARHSTSRTRPRPTSLRRAARTHTHTHRH